MRLVVLGRGIEQVAVALVGGAGAVKDVVVLLLVAGGRGVVVNVGVLVLVRELERRVRVGRNSDLGRGIVSARGRGRGLSLVAQVLFAGLAGNHVE